MAREVGGELQRYTYDKRGQLLAVLDGKNRPLEQYTYDKAGNILEKVVDGVRTSFTYDKANQLVSSECNGKVTKYEYDAAGRLVKEGNREYQYGWLDKVLQMSEGAEMVRSYSYHMDGQLASASDGRRVETFLWDGLALIRRDGTNYLNEPAVTGGNPVMAGDKVLFNDLLGSTLGAKSAAGFSAIERDAFGEVKPGESADLGINFFTGKPQVEGLGYTFLFRNYRPDQGKWQTADPLGYPDGWNNFAYVNNGVTMAIDWLGGKTAGKNIQSLVDHPGGGFMDRNSTVVREYTRDQQFGYWPGTTTDNLGGSGANVSSGLYTYELENGTRRDQVFALLHELLHAYDINIEGHIPLPGGDPEREKEINRQVSELMNDPSAKAAFADILDRYPSQGVIRKGQGLIE